MIKVVPAIIPQNKEQLEEEIKKVARFAKLIQVDISDGIFTPTRTWPYNGQDTEFFQQLKTQEIGWPKWEDVEIEVHLMVKNPETVVGDWINTAVSAIVAHVEATNDFQKIIDICREASVSVGLAIKPSTDISRLEPFISQIDFIQVMGSDDIGKHGVSLDEKAIEQIEKLRKLYPERIIAIDIGVTEETAETLVKAGANKLISGSEILNSDNPEEVFRALSGLK